MKIGDVLQQIKSNNTLSFYIFTGTEIEVQWLYIKQIAKLKKQEIKYVYDFSTIYEKLKNPSFISKSYCYVVRDDKDIITNEKLWEQLGSSDLPFNIVGDNTLIVLLSEVDKRIKFHKHYKDDIVEFESLPEQMLIKYIQKEIPLKEKNCVKLSEICENNYGRILLEIDKIKRYLQSVDPTGDDLTWDKGFERLLKDGTIYQPPKDAIFDFVDAVLRRQPQRVFQLLRESYDCGEATMVLLSVLYTNIKQMLQVQSCKSDDVCKSTGLTAWQVKLMKEKMGNWGVGELVSFMRDIRNAEVGIKKGEIEDSFAMEYVLAKNI